MKKSTLFILLFCAVLIGLPQDVLAGNLWSKYKKILTSYTHKFIVKTYEGPVGPQGPAGPPGPVGPQGPKGDPGKMNVADQQCPDGEVLIGFDSNGDILCTAVPDSSKSASAERVYTISSTDLVLSSPAIDGVTHEPGILKSTAEVSDSDVPAICFGSVNLPEAGTITRVDIKYSSSNPDVSGPGFILQMLNYDRDSERSTWSHLFGMSSTNTTEDKTLFPNQISIDSMILDTTKNTEDYFYDPEIDDPYAILIIFEGAAEIFWIKVYYTVP